MAYKKPEQVAEALKQGCLKYESVLQSISRYRRLDRIERVLIYLVGAELYRHWCRQNGLKHLEGATEDDLV